MTLSVKILVCRCPLSHMMFAESASLSLLHCRSGQVIDRFLCRAGMRLEPSYREYPDEIGMVGNYFSESLCHPCTVYIFQQDTRTIPSGWVVVCTSCMWPASDPALSSNTLLNLQCHYLSVCRYLQQMTNCLTLRTHFVNEPFLMASAISQFHPGFHRDTCMIKSMELTRMFTHRVALYLMMGKSCYQLPAPNSTHMLPSKSHYSNITRLRMKGMTAALNREKNHCLQASCINNLKKAIIILA